MNICYAVYSQSDGEILRVNYGVESDISINTVAGEAAIIVDTANDESQYVDTIQTALVDKGDYSLSMLPLPCTVTIEGTAYPCTEQPVFELSPPGTYDISVDAGVRYLRKTFEYEQL